MTLPPGPELDRAVAEAIGMTYAGYCRRGPMFCWPGEKLDELPGHVEIGVEFSPSTDLNHAFQAAEMAGMFLELNRLADSWQAHTYAMNGKSCTATTPALAICYAILKHTC